MNAWRARLILLTLALALPILVRAEKAHDLYQQALVAERAAGNLKRAISLYEQVVAAAGADRELAAKALIQIGRAYETLGNAEAKKAYQRVVEEFGDQKDAVVTARTRLASLARAVRDKDRPQERAARLVWKPVIDAEGEVSADGRFFSFVDWDTGDMAVRDLEKGVTRRLTDKGPWEKSSAFAGQSRISPDQKLLAYTWYDEQRIVDLRLVGTNGSSPRILFRDDSVEYVEPGHFSPDGKRVLVSIKRRDKTSELGIVDVEEGRLETLARFDERFPRFGSFSPDGRWIVFHLPQKKGVTQNDVFVMPAAGGTARAVAPNSANEQAVGFSPDGRKILFLSWRSGEPALWAAEFDPNGHDAEPRLLDSQVGHGVPFGISRDGSFFYEVAHENREGYLLNLDADGNLQGAPRRIGEAVGVDRSPTFSKDGTELLYISSRGAGNPTRPREPVYVFRDLRSGRERTVPARVASHYQGLKLSPDGKLIALSGHYLGEPGLYLVDAETGEPELLESVKRDYRQFFPAWSSGGEALYYLDQVNGRRVIKRRDRDSGERSIVFQVGEGELLNGLAVSPDGKWLAFLRSPSLKGEVDWLQILPVVGGEPRDLLREPVRKKGTNITRRAGLVWTPDGKSILFGRWTGWSMQNQNIELYRLPVAGGPAETIGVRMSDIWAMRLSPDGRTLGFTSGDPENELWVLENFLPSEASRRSHPVARKSGQ